MTEDTRNWLISLMFVVVFGYGLPGAIKHGPWAQVVVYGVLWSAGIAGLWSARNKR